MEHFTVIILLELVPGVVEPNKKYNLLVKPIAEQKTSACFVVEMC